MSQGGGGSRGVCARTPENKGTMFSGVFALERAVTTQQLQHPGVAAPGKNANAMAFPSSPVSTNGNAQPIPILRQRIGETDFYSTLVGSMEKAQGFSSYVMMREVTL